MNGLTPRLCFPRHRASPPPTKKNENSGNRADYATLHLMSLTADAMTKKVGECVKVDATASFSVYLVAEAGPLCAASWLLPRRFYIQQEGAAQWYTAGSRSADVVCRAS